MERHGLKEACAYVQTRESYLFLKKQSDVSYSALLLDEDILSIYKNEKIDLAYLKELESEYGIPTLWQYLNADRVIRSGQLVREYPYDKLPYTHEEMLAIVQTYAKHIIAFLDNEKPDFLFAPQVAGVGTLLLSHIAQKRGIKTYFVMNAGLEAITSISERYNCLTGANAILARDGHLPLKDILFYKEAETLIKAFRAKPRTYSKANDNPLFRSMGRKDQLRFLHPKNFLRSIEWFITMVWQWVFIPGLKHDYTVTKPWWYVWDRIRRKARTVRGYRDLYGTFDPKVPFAFLALHVVPELALLVHAPFTQNEIENARNVAQALPVGMKLYVKEHPAMVNYRTRTFYKALLQIPNVVLLPPELRATDIIPHASLVVTITGMVGLEATLMSKPVITMGNVLYNVMPNVRHVHAPDQLPAVVKELLEMETVADEHIIRFVAAIMEDGVRVDMTYLWTLESDQKKIREELVPYVARLAENIGLTGIHL